MLGARAGRILLLISILGTRALAQESPEDKALTYLAREVPRWSSENHCYSCHNNGDAARALYAATRLGRAIPPESTADTTRWLARPEGWEKNGGGGPASDKLLARIQFTAALASAVEAGQLADKQALIRAADRMSRDQAPDGSWRIEELGRVGSPATYGRPLATWTAREALNAADPIRFRDAIERADAWLGRLEPSSVLDASTILLAKLKGQSPESREATLDLLRRGQAMDGGWGPYEKSPPEVFDTALALLALDRHRDRPGVPSLIARGRAYLIENQQDDGSWIETTRPSGSESYAQRLSTSGWATVALLTVKAP
ncbi:hypothetical protein P12x_000681 [Tundrisphaera lichenicola]|uniref:hypothetical protein n=1 Tax=Tundrisphaera lichenicola TaxID=2029860 RepID=UPI003EBB0F47